MYCITVPHSPGCEEAHPAQIHGNLVSDILTDFFHEMYHEASGPSFLNRYERNRALAGWWPMKTLRRAGALRELVVLVSASGRTPSRSAAQQNLDGATKQYAAIPSCIQNAFPDGGSLRVRGGSPSSF